MQLDTITMARDDARTAYHEYRDHGDTAEDAEIARGYRALAAGYDIIRLDDTIRAGGLDNDGRPRFAVMRADQPWCYLRHDTDGELWFMLEPRPHANRSSGVYHFPLGTLPTHQRTWPSWRDARRAMVPNIPPRLRPPHNLSNYEILWEVEEWAPAPAPPGDPALLKHLGGQLYAVLATWDLTPLEQAVLSGRVM